MIFDLSFVELELEAARTGEISPELLAHPAFGAIAAHEAELQRPVWDEESFRARFAEAKKGNTENYADWGLAPLFQDRAKIEGLKNQIEREEALLTKRIDEWLARFTTVPQRENLRCVAYAGSYDAGFSPDVGNAVIYMNLPVFTNEEGFLETLVHESYHARAVKPEAGKLHKEFEASQNPIEFLMYIVAEEGTANFVGYNGSMTTEYPVIPLRTPEEGSKELKSILKQYAKGEMTAEDALNAFMQTDCCYTGGSYIANSVWEKMGREGLDLWAEKADLKGYYEAFRSTFHGADWPELEL